MSASRSTPGRLLYLSGAPRVSTHPDAASGGARAHVLGIVEGFERAGWTVDRFIVGDEVDDALRGRVSRAVTDVSGSAWGSLRRLAGDVARLTVGAANARRLAHRIDPNVTWAYERFATLQRLGRVPQRRGIPWILETQGPFFHEAANDRRSLALTGLARRRELDAYRRCDVLVCVSTALRDLIVDLSGIDPAKVVVVPNGVDERAFDPERTVPRRLTPESTFTIGYVGGLPPWQALDRLFAAVARSREQIGDVAVVVVGDGPSRAAWTEAAERAALGGIVHWAGRVPRTDVPAYLAGFDVGYSGPQPSSLGTMYHSPLKLYEYLAMG
ncbi:MAG: glycosyltransferase, partial [Trueperaceae bacterium]